jgi:hypothetical protein
MITCKSLGEEDIHMFEYHRTIRGLAGLHRIAPKSLLAARTMLITPRSIS